ncbi:MAG: hypothetical protein HYY09_08480 [Firmicutes bacterium]|nr:hypothetical protein [Bacillota bacterium]
MKNSSIVLSGVLAGLTAMTGFEAVRFIVGALFFHLDIPVIIGGMLLGKGAGMAAIRGVGLAVHYLIGISLGVIYALILARLESPAGEEARLSDPGSLIRKLHRLPYALKGLLYIQAAELINLFGLFPAAGLGPAGVALGGVKPAVVSVAVHLAYGLIVGLTAPAFARILKPSAAAAGPR